MIDPSSTQALQASIAPCVVISAAGLLLLSMSNRLARPIDRIRLLCAQIKLHPGDADAKIHQQIKILFRRCRYLRSSIMFTICSVVFVSLIILLMFLGSFQNWPPAILLKTFFILSLVSLVVGLIFFLLDILLALHSLEIEIESAGVDI